MKLGIAGRFCPSMQLINSFGEGVTHSGGGGFSSDNSTRDSVRPELSCTCIAELIMRLRHWRLER